MKLELRDIAKSLGGRDVLGDVAITLESGQILAIVGGNGAGKSTLLRIVAGVWEPDAGELRLDEVILRRGDLRLRARLGYMADGAEPSDHLTVGEFLDIVAALKRARRPSAQRLATLGVEAMLSQRFGTLSLGQRRRACLAAALTGDPWLLVLDEPTAGLDAAGIEELAAIVRAHRDAGGAVLVASHENHFLEALSADQVRLVRGRTSPVR